MFPALVLAAALAAAPVTAETPPPPAPDYASATAWACRPDTPGACATDLDALKVTPDLKTTPDPFKAAADPPIDCFYVYPTVSRQAGDYAQARREEAVDVVVRRQAAWLAERCRVFAPLYRQLTSSGLDKRLDGGKTEDASTWAVPYTDVRAAWRQYLAHDNHGRGVVLVGHSQGSILLATLIKRDIEGTSAARLMVSAILAGHPGVLVPKGADVGGTFASTPLCRTKSQTGCVVVWSTYAADAPPTPRFFARNHNGMVAACVNPAAPGGGPATLRPVLTKPAFAPADAPPFVEPVDQVSGVCAPDGGGTVLQVTPLPGATQPLMQTLFARVGKSPGWGLHILDMGLVEDDVLDLIGQQADAWKAAKR